MHSLDEIERQQREERKEEGEYKRSQLRFNKWLTIFTGLLFLTSVAADILIVWQIAMRGGGGRSVGF